MNSIYSTPEGVSFLRRQECEARYDQMAATYAGDPQAFELALVRQIEATTTLTLLAIAQEGYQNDGQDS